MRVAVFISGQPRFTKDLSAFVENLQGADSVDWFIQLWDRNTRPDKLNAPNFTLIHDLWREPTEEKVRSVFARNLPAHHSIVHIDIGLYNPPPVNFNYNRGPNSVDHNVAWPQWWGWKLSSENIKAVESKTGVYDRIIKARPDIGLPVPLDIRSTNADTILTANNGQHGFGRYRMNDLIGIGSSKNMHAYCDVINAAAECVKECVFHQETVLACHLTKLGIGWTVAPWTVSFRTHQPNDPLTSDWGNWIP